MLVIQRPQDGLDLVALHEFSSPKEIPILLRQRETGFQPIEPWQQVCGSMLSWPVFLTIPHVKCAFDHAVARRRILFQGVFSLADQLVEPCWPRCPINARQSGRRSEYYTVAVECERAFMPLEDEWDKMIMTSPCSPTWRGLSIQEWLRSPCVDALHILVGELHHFC